MTRPLEPDEQLDAVLQISGVSPPEEDRPALLRAFIAGREQSALVFSVAAARYEEPALIFSARL